MPVGFEAAERMVELAERVKGTGAREKSGDKLPIQCNWW